MSINKIKKLKKRLDLGGNLSTLGISNDNVNKPHFYFDSALRAMAGSTEGMASLLGLDGVIRAMNEKAGVQDQIDSDPNAQIAKGATAGIVGTVSSALTSGIISGKNSMGNNMGNGMTPEQNAYMANSTAVDAANAANGMAFGGNMFPNGGELPTAQEIDDWNNLLKYYNKKLLEGKYERNQLNSGDLSSNIWKEYASSNPNFKYDPNTYISKMQSYYNSLQGNPLTAGIYGMKKYPSSTLSSTDNIIGEYTSQYYIPKDYYHNEQTGVDEVRILDPYATENPWKTVNRTDLTPIDAATTGGSGATTSNKPDIKVLPAGYNLWDASDITKNRYKSGDIIFKKDDSGTFSEIEKVKRVQALGGEMLTEFNAGGTHEMNPLGGIPVGQNNLVEEKETKFTPSDTSKPEFVFSEREKDKDTGRSYSSLSKSIKKKYSLRPHDNISKESMDKELSILADKQEAQKQEKAMKLIQKAQELAPDMFENTQDVMNNPSSVDIPGMNILAKGGGINPEDWYNITQGANELRNRVMNPFYGSNIIDTQDTEPIEPAPVNTVKLEQPKTELVAPIIPKVTNSSIPPTDKEEYQDRLLFNSKAPKDFTGLKAGMFGLQSLGEMLRLGMTPDSKLVGDIQLDKINPYLQQLIAEQQANQQRANYMAALRNSGANKSQYLAAITTGLGDMNIGNTIAGINAQGQLTNAGIQSQEAQINKNLELQRNDIIAQDIANKSNQMGAVGAGLVQNMSTALTDKQKKEMDMFSLPFVATKENYELRYNPDTGNYEYYYTPPKNVTAMGGKLKKLKKYGGNMKNC